MNKDTDKLALKKIALTSQEQKMIEIVRSMDFGEIRVVITDGKPTRIEKTNSIKL